MVVNPDFPVHSVKDLIELAKQKPGTIDYASAGIGTSNHLTVELLKVMADIDIVHVPFRGRRASNCRGASGTGTDAVSDASRCASLHQIGQASRRRGVQCDALTASAGSPHRRRIRRPA